MTPVLILVNLILGGLNLYLLTLPTGNWLNLVAVIVCLVAVVVCAVVGLGARGR